MRLAIIGCGTIAQIMHIPYAVESPSVEVTALVDPATDRLRTLADRYNVPNQYASTDELISNLDDVGEPSIDGAIVLTPPHSHAETVLPLLERNVHTLVEKPLAVSPSDAERMVKAAEESDATAMIAYMKRYDPAYEQAKSEIDAIDDVDLITAYDVDPDHGRIIDEVYDIVGGDLPESFIEESSRKRHKDAIEAIGGEDGDTGNIDDIDAFADDYDWHLEHICHDVNLLRGLFGDVTRIEHVDVYAGGRYATAHLVYDGDNRCVLDSGLSERKWFEQWLKVDAPDRSITIDYSNPFIKNSATTVERKQGIENLSETTFTPSYDESFRCELDHFIRATQGEAEVKTPFAEGAADVRLISDLFRAYRDVESYGHYDGTQHSN